MLERFSWCAAAVLGCVVASGACASEPLRQPHAAMVPYSGEDELQRVLARWRERAAAHRDMRRRTDGQAELASQLAPAAPAADAAARTALPQESITNVQTAGVDEGGIVKRAGDHLVILRRGRLFTVRIGGDALEPAAMAEAHAPGIDPAGAWYDELLVSGTTAVVIGYSYSRGGTEIGLFELAPDGRLGHRATYHLRSFDYYSSRNYASRLIGRTLVFYTPTLLQPWRRAQTDPFAGLRRWQGRGAADEFERILPATRIYRTDDDFDPTQPLALHTVTRCELRTGSMDCESTAVLGGAARVFYVSQQAVYVWTAESGHRGWGSGPVESAVFRLPLDGKAPSALKTRGVPIDQLSFLEDAGGHLNVLLREWSRGEGMWGSERARGSLALLRVPIDAFGDGRGAARDRDYRRLPGPDGFVSHNRFVGDWLLWSTGQPWAIRYAGGGDPISLPAGHQVERIEPIGSHALLVGRLGQDLHFTGVRLTRESAQLAGGHVQPHARQKESRTHGFFYRPTGPGQGLLGLPIVEPSRTHRGVYSGPHGSASVLFLRERELDFSELGRLQAHPLRTRDDGCRASCVDWYGNARPIFIGERVFALMGYELVEGVLEQGATQRIVERRRVDFLRERASSVRW
ncbi:MAG TPA: beta-propeller domain-containing protein [Burkholderiaceae bacterium]|nr:beta-propeller domain-containing protein [Burkholderiaceae bacterium]